MRLLLLLLLLSPLSAWSGPGDSLLVEDVVLAGHRKTRPRVVFREMIFGKGDRLAVSEFPALVTQSYNNLMNTGLFAGVTLTYDTLAAIRGQGVTVIVDLQETWYIYPVPVFSLADRNFNVWWTEQDRALDRVNIGGKLTYYNFTGRRDRLRLGATTGYTRSYEAGYRLPYLNHAGSIGLDLNFSYLRRREQNYLTKDNRQEFFSAQDSFVYRRSSIDATIFYRRKIYVTHNVQFGWRQSRVADTIGQVLNPEFYGGGRTTQRYFRIGYDFENDRRDIRNYPWRGKYFSLGIAKEGLGIYGERDGLEVHGEWSKYIPFGNRYSFNYTITGKYSLIRTRQPFLENRAIGFGNSNLIGYQFYVVDGLDMLIWKVGLRREILRTKLDLGKLVFIDAFRYIPIRAVLNLQLNQGVANAPFIDSGSNRLNNTLLTGLGLGLDVVLYYDMVAGIQYNRNHLGDSGIYLNVNLSF